MKKYIISGIGPSTGGVGRLVKTLISYTGQHFSDVEVIYIYAKKNKLFKFLKESFLGDFLKLIFYKYFTQSGIKSRIKNITGSKVLVIHPQTLGFDNVYTLAENNNQLYFYVMDCGFFCMKSYNHISPAFTSCLACLGSSDFAPAVQHKCTPFPVSFQVDENIRFLRFLRENHSRFSFLAQNESQEKMIKRHFGEDCRTRIVGMYTDEMETAGNKDPVADPVSDPVAAGTETDGGIFPEIVYHGSLDEAKGILYVLHLAPFLQPHSVLIPYSAAQINGRYGKIPLPGNLVCQEMTWETGLEAAVKKAKLVLTPSVWSAPIEGAVLKSIYFNGCVASLNTECSFASDLISSDVLLELMEDYSLSAQRIKEILIPGAAREALSRNAAGWMERYKSDKGRKQKELFDFIFAD